MKVWIVTWGRVYPEIHIYGIYSTEERAEDVRRDLLKEEDNPNYNVWVSSMQIED